MSEWQPIETANPQPDDERQLLDDKTGQQVIAKWLKSATDGDQAWVYAREWLDGVGQVAFVMRSATHWRFLPAMPTGDQ